MNKVFDVPMVEPNPSQSPAARGPVNRKRRQDNAIPMKVDGDGIIRVETRSDLVSAEDLNLRAGASGLARKESRFGRA
jgi:hypothetical protein